MYKTVAKHKRYWADRKIDWEKDYFWGSITHPHRNLILRVLSRIKFRSVLEIGCGAGANLARIQKAFPGTEIGGVDINPDAIEAAKKLLPDAAVFEVSSADDLFCSDKSVDVVLTDMCLIYLSGRSMRKALREIVRVTRSYVVFVEFHTESFWKRTGLKLATGYSAPNYKKLLEGQGFYDILIQKFTEGDWPGGDPQKTFGHIITAKLI